MSLTENMMDSVATLKRPAITQGTRGGTEQTFEVIVTDVPCSVQQAGTGVVMLYAQRNVNVSVRLFFPEDIDARASDILETVDIDGNTHKFLVHGTAKGVFNRILAPYVVDAEELV